MKYQVKDFEIDITQYRVSCKDQEIAIEPKVFDLIVYLINSRERVVSRNELFDEIWKGREVSDTSLSNHIKTARRILDDNGELQQVIKTVRGRGYQFVAQVDEIKSDAAKENEHAVNKSDKDITDQTSILTAPARSNASAALSDDIKEPEGKAKFSVKKVVLWLGFAVLLLVVIAVSTSFNNSLDEQGFANSGTVSSGTANSATAKPYILVVPFDISGEHPDKWQPFADQITREVILKLRKISGLRVIPASSAFTFQQNKSHQYVREQLPDVRYLLSATVSIEGDTNIKVVPQLNDLSNNKLVWSSHYQSSIDNTNFFTVQTKIAAEATESLKVAVLDEEKRAIRKQLTANLAAYELFVEGQQQLNLLTYDSLKRSIEQFDKAIELDPSFEAAIVAKANAYRIIMAYFEKPIEVLPNVIDSVVKALEVNPNSAEAYSSLGLAYVFAWRWEDAWNTLNSAKRKDPNLAQTELGFALYYSGLGDIEGVKESLKKANDLDPLNIELADWGHWALAMVGEIEAASKWSQNKIQLHPDVGLIYSGASVSASLAGEHNKAIELAKKGVELESGAAYSLLALAQTYGHAGLIEQVKPLLQEAESQQSYICPYETAITYLLIDDTETAFKRLNEAVSYRSNCLVFTRNDPRLKPLKSDSRFDLLLMRVGLDDKSLASYSR